MTHRETGYAQIALTIIFLVGYFIVLSDFIHGRVRVDEAWRDTLQTLLSVLTAGVLLILQYWFSRQRTSNPTNGETP